MIRYALKCAAGHAFDAWFASSASYEEQQEAEAIRCPNCGSADVCKAPMAPAVLRGRRQGAKRERGTDAATTLKSEEPGTAGSRTYAFLKGLREHLKANADDVGDRFAEEARKMHEGDAEEQSIYGEATADEAKSLYEDGIPVLPLPKLPEDHN
jgi:hypothetical protein